MNVQTNQLLNLVPPAIPLHVNDLLNAYVPGHPGHVLNLCLYAEPYYGDFTNCSMVFLTHNPGNSTFGQKGIGSPFDIAVHAAPLLIEQNYFNMATIPAFPNPATNAWVNNRNVDLQNHFAGLQVFNNQLFIRDLIPYHSDNFGCVNMPLCTNYLYKYFFNQVISSSFNCELYNRINMKSSKPATIIYARGAAWKHRFGLSSVGWKLIGRIYRNCYVYKADLDKIQKIEGFNLKDYPSELLNHDVYIVVITQIRQGARFGIYVSNHAPLMPISMADVIINYININNPDNELFIQHNHEMDVFIEKIS